VHSPLARPNPFLPPFTLELATMTIKLNAQKVTLSIFTVMLVAVGIASCSIGQEYISGIKWPEPPVVTPGKTNSDPPSDAIVLFDGKDFSAWKNAETWKIEGDAAVVGNSDITSKQSFGDCQLHVEWSAPVPPESEGQGRGNSGVFFMDRYELQVLDSYDNATYFDGQASSIYKQTPPMVNAMRPPGEWNTYDVIWTAPRFKDNGELESPAYITVFHNGVLTLNHFELEGITPFTEIPSYTAHGKGPIRLQNHGNPVRFRNIWVREFKPLKGTREKDPFYRDDTGREWAAKKYSSSVQGKVQLDGKPLVSGKVVLKSNGDPEVTRHLNDDGEFMIGNIKPGRYTVMIVPNEEDTAATQEIPTKYGSADKSGLTVEVVEDQKNAVELDLRSK
jgi:hypothetical protein